MELLKVSIFFEVPLRYSCRLGHARLCHFLLDAGTRRVVGVSHTFLMQHTPKHGIEMEAMQSHFAQLRGI